MSDGFRLSAASCSAHAIDFHLRELNAMIKWNGDIDVDALVAGLVAAVQTHPTDETLSALTRFPWFAFLVRFLATRIDGDADVRQLATTAALRGALPWSARAKLFGGVVDRLVARLSCRPASVIRVDGRVDDLLATVRTALIGECAQLRPVSSEFIGLVAHAYDGVANELRWLTLPSVSRRELEFDAGVNGLAQCKSVELDSLYSTLAFLCSPISMHDIADVTGGFHSLPFRNRLVVHLFDCIEHYVRVGGYEFVHRAASELLTYAERGDETRWPVLLQLSADVLCSPIVVLCCGALGKRFVVWPTVERYRATLPVVLVEQGALSWRIASLAPGTELPTLDEICILAPPSSPPPSATNDLFEKLRRGERQLLGNATIDDLLTLVNDGGWLTSTMVYSLVLSVTRDVDDVAVFDPITVDTRSANRRPVELEMARVRALAKRCVLVPWNNRAGHWTLLCIDAEQKLALYYDSLQESDSLTEQRKFCKWLLNESSSSIDVQFVKPSPRQPDGQSCGLFVAMNAWYVARKLPLPVDYAMEGCRLRVAKKWLLNEVLL